MHLIRPTWQGTIPIYVNNFNWLTTTRDLVTYFGEMPGIEVIIVDNASTFLPLLEWYAEECPCKVVRLDQNLGPHAPWNCSAILAPAVHEAFFGSPYYVLTDADLSFAECPGDVMNVLVEGLVRYPDVTKVGVSLEIEDLPTGSPIAGRVIPWERRFWQNRCDEQFFRAEVDTTFAVYRIGVPCDSNQLRSDRPYTARHIPWYAVPETLTDEERHYYARCAGGTWSTELREMFAIEDD